MDAGIKSFEITQRELVHHAGPIVPGTDPSSNDVAQCVPDRLERGLALSNAKRSRVLTCARGCKRVDSTTLAAPAERLPSGRK
ncbi:hypothetical protein QZM22_17740 [Burkholderia oklahomensis]|uniref:hypothetical protein n=1 Tax=Burkholderia oklahomensis TaxID=342113 RepID=UPI0026564AE2|nr:hypothetical protein [Burkholderia oklahomensis]MDN7674315.1 hypothetical protein [Burkholderia oklahomensis]